MAAANPAIRIRGRLIDEVLNSPDRSLSFASNDRIRAQSRERHRVSEDQLTEKSRWLSDGTVAGRRRDDDLLRIVAFHTEWTAGHGILGEGHVNGVGAHFARYPIDAKAVGRETRRWIQLLVGWRVHDHLDIRRAALRRVDGEPRLSAQQCLTKAGSACGDIIC